MANHTAFNIDHIVFGARPARIEPWAAAFMNGHAQASKPELIHYEVVAGSSTLRCESKEDAYRALKGNGRRSSKDFMKEHPKVAAFIGLSWKAAFTYRSDGSQFANLLLFGMNETTPEAGYTAAQWLQTFSSTVFGWSVSSCHF